jgi:HlyD family secretion protein
MAFGLSGATTMTTTTRGSAVTEAAAPGGLAAAFSVQSAPRAERRKRWIVLLAFGVLMVVAAVVFYLRPRVGKAALDTFAVTPRDFTVALHEKGELKAAKSIDIKCEVEGRSTIIWLIPEGTEVAEGDLLVRLASEQIDDRVKSEEIKEANSKAAAEAAAQEYDITLDEQASQIRKAELALQNAEIELRKYEEGDWQQDQTDAELAVKRAEEDFRQREAELQDSRDLFEERKFALSGDSVGWLSQPELAPELRDAFAGHDISLSAETQVTPETDQAGRWLVTDGDRRYSIHSTDGKLEVFYRRNFITKLELQRAEFALLEADIELKKAKLRKDILHKYTHDKNLRQKTSDVEEAGKELIRTRKSAEAKIAQKLADRDAKAAEYAFTQEQLEKFRKQQSKCQIKAPAAGLVVFDTGAGRWDRRQIAEGAEVYERQTIVKLPDTAVMQVLVRIHEGKANKVQIGQRARVEVEGLPGVILDGEVTKTAPLADSQDSWLNPELKEYQTEITLASSEHNLKPGVTARVEILIDNVDDALAVPVQAVVTKQGRRFVFRGSGLNPEPVQVELGRSNDEYVEILKGLAQGDRVHLAVNDDELARIPELPPEAQSAAERPKAAAAPPAPKPQGAPPAGPGGPRGGGGRGKRGSGGPSGG